MRGGSVLGLIVDHRLRPESAAEARLAAERLNAHGIASRVLALSGLQRGPRLAERARIARYAALTRACRDANVLHLLLGHHAGDQAETLAMRVLRETRDDGLAGMAAIVETPSLRLLRPLLTVDPATLRAFLAERAVAWVEDPSNQDRRALRSRLRQGLAGAPPPALSGAVASAGQYRARREQAAAAALARRASIRPEGYALTGPLPAAALAGLIQAIGGAAYPPDPDHVAHLARALRPATLAGTRIAAAGRSGPGWLVLREEAAIQPCVPASPDLVWDGRFRVRLRGVPTDIATIGQLGSDAVRFRRVSDLPAIVLRTLPALRIGKVLAAVPHLGYTSSDHDLSMTVMFAPPRPVSGAPFHPADVVRAV